MKRWNLFILSGEFIFNEIHEFAFLHKFGFSKICFFDVSKFEMVHRNQLIRILIIRTLVIIVKSNDDYDQRNIYSFLHYVFYNIYLKTCEKITYR